MRPRTPARHAWDYVGRDRDYVSDPYTNTNGSPSAKSTLTMITETKPIERKGWRGLAAVTG